MLPKAAFIEVDELMSDEEQKKLGLTLQQGWRERHKRLNAKLQALKKSQEFETVIFAYPISENSYKKWSSMADGYTDFTSTTFKRS